MLRTREFHLSPNMKNCEQKWVFAEMLKSMNQTETDKKVTAFVKDWLSLSMQMLQYCSPFSCATKKFCSGDLTMHLKIDNRHIKERYSFSKTKVHIL